ncbi:MAG: sulfatase [Verrucomicrobiales bacterium]|nr:sulfatase [Verrucomicrobiales bacterium]
MRISKLALFICTGLLTLSGYSGAAERPNVLMISIDDLNDWIGCLGGHPNAITPNLDALAGSGRNFTNAHCSVPVCSPSRVSVISGLSPMTSGSYELGPAYENIPRLDEVPTMQGFFKSHGYTTLSGGKILHHNFRGRLAADIDRILPPSKKGGPRPEKPFQSKPPWDWGAFPEKDEEMYDYQLAEAAAAELGKNHEKPFFLSVGLFRPHVPMYAPQKWYDLYDPDTITMPDADPDDMLDVPDNFQYQMYVAPTLTEIQEANQWRSLVHAFLANTSFVDHCLGVVLEGLENGPNKDNTIVVLWSDHGFHLGEKQKIAKRTLWEESTRVPLIFAGPGIEAGDCAEPVSLLDIYPTLVDLAGLSENPHLDGDSLNPQLNDPDTARKRPALTTSYFGNHTVRSRDWRYIRYADGAEELYDHRNDPGEHTNLAGNENYRSIIDEHAKWLPKNAAPEVKPLEEQEAFRAGRRIP